VKAILEFTSQNYPGYDALTQGAGFLNARGAVELANYFGSPSTIAYPSTDGWSGEILWGNYRIQGGQLTPDGTAWQNSVSWGAEPTASSPVSWGLICTEQCDGDAPMWSSWQATCLDPACTSVRWGSGASNVVWGTSCDVCASSGTGYASGTAVVWGSNDGDAVVWGSSDGGDAVVWGSSDGGDAVVWGSSCTDPSCTPVIWQH
jgi:hypothetical protein